MRAADTEARTLFQDAPNFGDRFSGGAGFGEGLGAEFARTDVAFTKGFGANGFSLEDGADGGSFGDGGGFADGGDFGDGGGFGDGGFGFLGAPHCFSTGGGGFEAGAKVVLELAIELPEYDS